MLGDGFENEHAVNVLLYRIIRKSKSGNDSARDLHLFKEVGMKYVGHNH